MKLIEQILISNRLINRYFSRAPSSSFSSAQSSRDDHVLACNFAQIFTNIEQKFLHRQTQQ